MNIIKSSILSIMGGAEICTQLLLLFTTLAVMLPCHNLREQLTLDPGSWFLVPRPWTLDPGSWSLDAVCQPPLGRLLMSLLKSSASPLISGSTSRGRRLFSVRSSRLKTRGRTRLRLLTLPRAHALVSGCHTCAHQVRTGDPVD